MIEVQFGGRDSLFARDPLKLLGQINYVSEKNASYRSIGFRMCVINSVFLKGEKHYHVLMTVKSPDEVTTCVEGKRK